MNATLFNACLLVAWLLVLAGGCLINVGAGLVVAGLLLLGIVFVVARIAGVYMPKAEGTP